MADLKATLAERGARYGDFSDHAVIAQELQTVMHTAETRDATGARMGGWARLSAVQKQALTVIADKIARILSGDPNYTDNWHDIQGYARLAEERCVDATLPQLDLEGYGAGHSKVELDRIAASLNGPLADQHLAARWGDEYFCSRCTKRWGVDEDAPESCA